MNDGNQKCSLQAQPYDVNIELQFGCMPIAIGYGYSYFLMKGLKCTYLIDQHTCSKLSTQKNLVRPQIKYFLFPLTQPTLEKWPYPKKIIHDLKIKDIFFFTKIYTFSLEGLSHFVFIMPPTLKKWGGAYWFRLVRMYVRMYVFMFEISS